METLELTTFCEAADNLFGPVVPTQCRGGFDFTLFFEQAVLSILPSAAFILLSLMRLAKLYRAQPLVQTDRTHAAKLFAILAYAALCLASLVLWSLPSTYRTKASIPSAVLCFISSISLFIVSHYEHTRRRRPSTLLAAFLTFSCLCDISTTRTLWLMAFKPELSILYSITTGMKAVVMILEAQEKTLKVKSGQTAPRESLSSIYSRSFFWWINPLFLKGFKNIIELRDLDNLEDPMTSKTLHLKMKQVWANAKNKKSRWALLFSLCSALKYPLLLPVPARLALIGFNYSQPFMVTAAVNYIQGTASNEADGAGYGLIGASIIIYLGISISNGQYNYQLYRAITMIRGCLVSIIYDKTMQLPSTTAKGSAALTLMSSDVDRIALTAETAYEIWAGLLEIGIAIYLLERQIGWACIAPLLLAVVSLAGNSTIGKLIPSRLKQWQQAVQSRVALTSKILRNMRSVKMMGLSTEMVDFLQDARRHELERSAHFRWFVAFMNMFGALPRLLSAPFTFLIFVFSAQFFSESGLSAARAFTTLSLLELLTGPLGKLLQSIPVFTATFGCLDRIQEYLLLDGQAEYRIISPSEKGQSPRSHSSNSAVEVVSLQMQDKMATEKPDVSSSAIVLDNITIRYGEGPPVLKGISFHVNKGELVMIAGPVGCGKTTLLRTLIGELGLADGALHLSSPEVAYCDQTPWLTNQTIRENIAGQSNINDDVWYKIVVSSCALDDDIANWPDGDATLVGSGGISCSGGQKQRLALARAIYSRKPVIILDDVLSALDKRTESLIFSSLFSKEGLLKRLGTTVVLATSSSCHLSSADDLVILDADGHISAQGSYHDLVDLEKISPAPEIPIYTPEENLFDPLKVQTARNTTPKVKTAQTSVGQKDTRQVGDLRCYSIYGSSMGWTRAVLFLVFAILFAFFSRFSQVWLQWFTDSPAIDRSLFIGIYFLFSLSTVVFSVISFWWMMIVIIPVSAASLHKQLVTAVFRAPLGFFTSTDMGVILNRFSQDMQYAVAQLPISTMNAVQIFFVCTAQIALISAGSGYLAISIPFLIFMIWYLQKFYLSTSRQLRLLDLEHKSPLYSSLMESVEGLSTIRAFGWTASFERLFLKRLDESQRPVYFLYCIQRWLNFVLDLIIAALATLLMALATQLRDIHGSSSGALFGVAMVSIIGFSQNLGQFIFFYTELETSLGAITRIKEYTDIQPEDEPALDERQSPPGNWPSEGAIRFDNITLRYKPDDDPVVKEVSLDIPSGLLVAISGRTGSGKSSLLLSLLRLLIPSSGAIYVDGVDISKLPGELVRSRITTIPQDPYFPDSRTIRASLGGVAKDGRKLHTDSDLVGALDTVGLLAHMLQHTAGSTSENTVNGQSDATGQITMNPETTTKILDATIGDIPLSAGQLQLFCLAHTLLQDDQRIILLDEVTSALDQATEERLCTVLRDRFRGRTVLMIAHRPEMLNLCDYIVHIDGGRIVGQERR